MPAIVLATAMMARFAQQARELVLSLCPGYAPHLRWGLTSFRPVEARGEWLAPLRRRAGRWQNVRRLNLVLALITLRGRGVFERKPAARAVDGKDSHFRPRGADERGNFVHGQIQELRKINHVSPYAGMG